MKSKALAIQYRFQTDNGQEDIYKFKLDAEKLQIVSPLQKELPDWTKLNFHKCINCTLSSKTVFHCPPAVNLVGVVSRFAELLSYDKTLVVVVTSERMVYSHTTVQRGVSSLIGLLMAASGCPHTAFFKPMARFHLPFASTEETIWRATSTYLLAQYFLQQEGRQIDLNFKGLHHIYDEIQTVNMAFAQRLRAASRYDSMVNAIILLDMFAKSMPTAIEESLEEIRHLFVPYLNTTT